jgi:hypothetical protein
MAMTYTTAARNAVMDFFDTMLDGGTIELQTAAHAEVATLTFGATAFAAADTGVAVAEAISPDTNAAGGIIDHAHYIASDTTELAALTCTVNGGDGDLTFSNLTIGASDTVGCNSLTHTQAASV